VQGEPCLRRFFCVFFSEVIGPLFLRTSGRGPFEKVWLFMFFCALLGRSELARLFFFMCLGKFFRRM